MSMARGYKLNYHDEREERPIWLLITPAVQAVMIKYQKRNYPLEGLEDLPKPSDMPDKRYNPKPENLDEIAKRISKRPHYPKGVGYH